MSNSEDVAVLQGRVKDLEAALGLRDKRIGVTFRLSTTQSDLLGLLLSLPNITPELVRQRLDLVTDAKVYICRLRKHLEPHGIVISSRRNVGYWLEPEMKKRVKEIIEARFNDTPPSAQNKTPTHIEHVEKAA